jgi:hypothetical protein
MSGNSHSLLLVLFLIGAVLNIDKRRGKIRLLTPRSVTYAACALVALGQIFYHIHLRTAALVVLFAVSLSFYVIAEHIDRRNDKRNEI